MTQLLAIGAQDVHLTGNPEVSFFRSTYKRHTNFSHTIHEQIIQGSCVNNGTSIVRFEKLGDLLSYVYIVPENLTNREGIELGEIEVWSNVITEVDLLIGGQVVDTQTTEFNQELAIDLLAQDYSKSSAASLMNGLNSDSDFYPLRFFFCENWNSCLPLVALEYHDVEIRITWGPKASNYNFRCYANYFYLHEDERKYFQKNTLDMLIFQVQKNVGSNDKIQELNFTGPVKCITSSNATDANDNPLTSRTNKITLEVNGIQLSDPKPCRPHYTSIPSYYHVKFSSGNVDNQFIYPFCLDIPKLQPTGTLNFSRLVNAKIVSDEVLTKNIYAINYNLLRIQNGMGGVFYIN